MDNLLDKLSRQSKLFGNVKPPNTISPTNLLLLPEQGQINNKKSKWIEGFDLLIIFSPLYKTIKIFPVEETFQALILLNVTFKYLNTSNTP